MDDACRVGVGQGIGELHREIDGAAGIERPAGDGCRQALARDELEDEKQPPLIFPDLVQRRDIRVRQRCSGARLSQDAFTPIGIAGESWRHHLDRHGPAEPRIARAVDLAHPAGADSVEDLVVPDGVKHVKRDDYTGASTWKMGPTVNPYVTLLRTNRNFRLLYIGQTISQLGDWFNAVAVYALLLDLTGSATAVAWMMIVQFLPVAVVGPLAGVVVDRVDRRRLMIATDLLRGSLILGLLLVRRPSDVWIAYVVMALTVGGSAFFEPARTATIPNLTSPDELVPANALSSATWSAMLAIGASLGGVVTAAAGREVAFIVNAASFFVSAVFIARTRYDATPAARPRRIGWAALTGVSDLVEGMRYVRQQSHVAALMFVKAGWGLAGGILLLLTIFGHRIFPVGGSTAAGIGVLYGARGIGAGIGPIALRWILGQRPQTLRRAIGPAYFMIAIFYSALAAAPTLPLAAVCVLFAHFGGSILWVFSTVLLQMEVPDRFRGRVFAAELTLVTLSSSVSSYCTGYALDRLSWSPRALSLTLGLMFCVPGAVWLLILSRWRDSGTGEPATPDAVTSAQEDVFESRVG
jgi:predicted MFS family arabinose efflux permease